MEEHPTGEGGHPQREKQFEDEDPQDADQEPKRKRAVNSLTTPGSKGIYARQRAWCLRGDENVHQNSWRPRPVHRSKAKQCGCALDNQVKWSTPWSDGLVHLKPKDTPEWQHWSTRPWLGVASDLGPEELSFLMAAQYKWNLNLGRRPDGLHGNHCDFDKALKAAQLKGLWATMAVSWNLRFGLQEEESRNAGLNDCMEVLYNRYDETLPVFVNHLPRLTNMFRSLSYSFDSGKSTDRQVWEWCKELNNRPMGSKLVMARFESSLTVAMKKKSHLPLDCWERTCLAIEKDVVTGSQFVARARRAIGEAEEVKEGGGSTSVARVTMESRSLLSACKQAVGASVHLLSSHGTLRIIDIVCTLAEPSRYWSDAVAKLRHADHNEEWAIEQIGKRKYYVHINAIKDGNLGNLPNGRFGF